MIYLGAGSYKDNLQALLIKLLEQRLNVPSADITVTAIRSFSTAKALPGGRGSGEKQQSERKQELSVRAHTHFYIHAADETSAYQIASDVQSMRDNRTKFDTVLYATLERTYHFAKGTVQLSFLAPALLLENDGMNISKSVAVALLGADVPGIAAADQTAASPVSFALGILCAAALLVVLRMPSNLRWIMMMVRLYCVKWKNRDDTPVSAYDALAYTRSSERNSRRTSSTARRRSADAFSCEDEV